MVAHVRSSCGSKPGGHVEVETVDGTYSLRAAGVLDYEILNTEIAHGSRTPEGECRVDGYRAAQSRRAGDQADDDRDHGQ